jgi:hypothetical protein
MGGSKSKNKGSSFEREVATFMSKLYNESFVRAPHSGAYIGGTNSYRKEYLSENQAKSFKGDIIPPDGWNQFNAEAKSYADFPFHLVLTGECKQLNSWLDQLMAVAESNDVNILFMKFNRKGKFVCVQSKLTWITDQFLYYTSEKYNDWILIEFDHFWKHNKDLFKTYASGANTTDTKSSIENLKTKDILSTLK